MKLLLIEDNRRLAGFTSQGLKNSGFAVDCCHDLESAGAALATGAFDLLVLDLGMPDGDGLAFLKALRRRGEAVPVLVLTARGKLAERVEGLNAGADDYVVKPFELEELVARLHALLRRPGNLLGSRLRIGNVELDAASSTVAIGGAALLFSKREIGLLTLLMRRARRVVGKEAVVQNLYSFDEEASDNAVEVLVHRVRRKLTAAGASVGIHTVRGIGYMLTEDGPGPK